MADQRQRIIASVFSRRNAAGELEETYVSHIKIWEDAGPEGGGRKPRYILLSQASNGSGFIHKSKLNTNGTYSVGKTWRLSELRGVQVANSLAFNITLSRTYRWQTENEGDQIAFIDSMVRLFRGLAGNAPLQLEGVPEPPIDNGRSPSPAARPPNRGLASQNETREARRGPSPVPAPQSQPRGGLPSRASSPTNSQRGYPSNPRPREPPQSRAPSPTNSQSGSARNGRPRRPSDAPVPVLRERVPEVNIPPAIRGNRVPERQPSPPRPQTRSRQPERSQALQTDGLQKRDPNARISYFDPTNQMTLERLLEGQADVDGEEENAQATMASVEEMLEGYEWASDDVIGRKTAGSAGDLIEARLLDELTALEKANIHSFLESDDRVGVVLKFMDAAIAELDNMDSYLSSYKIHLNAVGDDISYIQSQNRGLQVQTQNQKALLKEIENLLQTVHVDQDALLTLTQESLEKTQSIEKLEGAVTELYKALQAGRDTEMAATMERLEEYRTHNTHFCKRTFEFLSFMFTAQAKLLLGDTDGMTKPAGARRPILIPHGEIEAYLGRYAGLMLYLKEMDETVYGKLCAAYFSSASELHGTQVRALFSTYIAYVKKAPDEEQEQALNTNLTAGLRSANTIRRAGTLIRSPIENRQRDRDKGNEGDLRASEAFGLILDQLATLIYKEDEFISDFLQINDVALTFADYMGLDNYFRRQAARVAGLSQTTMKLIRGAMELTFSFLPEELKKWLDSALAKDQLEVIGLILMIERFLADADERGNQFLLTVLGKQHTRLKGLYERHINEQIKGIEQTKLTSKKRRGVASFIKQFPSYLGRVENQLIGADGLEIRTTVNEAHDKIVQSMFDCLKQMAKMDGEGEDKGQLNYHVILIENMHHFVAEITQTELGSVTTFLRRAEGIYEENLNAYVKIVIRRPFAKIIDYFEGVERIIKAGSPNDVAANSNYNKSALKKVVKEYNPKDVRKHIDGLFKRVEKHFTEASEKPIVDEGGGIAPGTVLVGVWKACEEELLRITEFFLKRISQCYPDGGIPLEYSTNDIETQFKRHRIGF
ncbi:hypothetical protein BDN72DRAFT_784249 [Pluteus cervinus]|uniref:Uncharacterized protein n=1 Tax=Pluteus cervinus TaxID=181527 RepID=A0ACD3BH87_9AGAR|nr:hypothetical protein BDN72DRAFT_784249 [Pluteus cervinus]